MKNSNFPSDCACRKGSVCSNKDYIKMISENGELVDGKRDHGTLKYEGKDFFIDVMEKMAITSEVCVFCPYKNQEIMAGIMVR